MALSKTEIGKEFARRANLFHPKEKPMEIRLWGLFSWGSISPYVKTGEITLNKGFAKENKIVWCKPSQKFYNKWVAHLIKNNK